MDEFSPESHLSPPHCRQESHLACIVKKRVGAALGGAGPVESVREGKDVMIASSASAGLRVKSRRSVSDAGHLSSRWHRLSVSSCERRFFPNIATEKMANPRYRCVVLKPVCTPVPPVRYGYAAGHVGYAPPRIRAVAEDCAYPDSQRQLSRRHIVPKFVSRRPCSLNGKITARATAITRLQKNSAFYLGLRAFAAAPAQREERSSGASAVSWDCSPSQPKPLPGATRVLWVRSKVSRPGSG